MWKLLFLSMKSCSAPSFLNSIVGFFATQFISMRLGCVRNATWCKLLQGPARKFRGHLTPYIDDYTRMERVLMVLQGIGVVCTLIVLAQLVNAGGLPLSVIFVTGLAVSGQFVLQNFETCICPRVQQLCQDAIDIGGLSVLPQVIIQPCLIPQPWIYYELSALEVGSRSLCDKASDQRLDISMNRAFPSNSSATNLGSCQHPLFICINWFSLTFYGTSSLQ